MHKETVEAEIKVIMLTQRACGAENQAENRSSNGPPRAQSTDRKVQVFCDVWHASAAGDIICILLSVRLYRESRWHRGFD